MTSIDPAKELTWIIPAWRELLAIGYGLANLADNHEATEAFIRRDLAEAGGAVERIGHMMQNLAAKVAAEGQK